MPRSWPRWCSCSWRSSSWASVTFLAPYKRPHPRSAPCGPSRQLRDARVPESVCPVLPRGRALFLKDTGPESSPTSRSSCRPAEHHRARSVGAAGAGGVTWRETVAATFGMNGRHPRPSGRLRARMRQSSKCRPSSLRLPKNDRRESVTVDRVYHLTNPKRGPGGYRHIPCRAGGRAATRFCSLVHASLRG